MRQVLATAVAPRREVRPLDRAWLTISDQLLLEVALLDPGARVREQRDAATEADEPPRTVVVADDDPEMRAYVAQCLRAVEPRVDVLEAADGIEALTLLASNKVDLVITDVVMPRLDGIALCERIQDDEELRKIPILLVSGEVALEALRGAKSMDLAVAQLAKPFSARMLRDAIAPLLA